MAANSTARDVLSRKHKLEALAKGIATIPGGLVNENYRLIPIIISNCNGAEAWPFTMATLDYKEGFSFPLSFWLPNGAECILNLLVEKGQAPNSAKMEAIDTLLDFVCEEKHLKCLKWLKDKDQMTDAAVQAVLAVHLFAPLTPDETYLIDSHSPGRLTECPSCCKNINLGDTSLGNTSVWHGNTDIEIERSVVKIEPELISPTEEARGQQNDSGDISHDSSSCVEEKGENCSVAKRPRSGSTGTGDDSVSDFESWDDKKMARSQAIAQAIVNAFCEVRTNGAHFSHSYIPSFLATKNHIIIILYNCQKDKLLYSEPLLIWKESGTLDFSSLIHIWLALNFNKFETNLPFEKSLPLSNFKKIVCEKLDIYSAMVSKPSVKVAKQSYSMNLQRYALDKAFRSTVDKMTILNEYSLLVSNMEETAQHPT